MASRLEGRVARVEQKLSPSGGHNIVKAILAVTGQEYIHEPGDELITLEDVVSAANAEWRAELAAQQAAASRKTENVLPLAPKIPSGAPGRAFGGERYWTRLNRTRNNGSSDDMSAPF